jgi:hypothetical protein
VSEEKEQSEANANEEERKSYEAPAVIYRGRLA